ncbi:hypothetical protein HRD50_36155 [Corallococcus exiguus]|nr:hypothetical protein [Corallococcus exiguus]NRD49965.1 hypothetical protein [Corallococcus exiguus]
MRRAVIALLPLLCVLPSFQQAQAKELAALVRDLTPGTQSGSPSTFTALGNTRFFFANTHGRIDVWRSDGTTLGTVSVSHPPSATTGQEPGGRGLVVGNALYFVANNLHDLVRMDGTSASTAVVAEDSSPQVSWSNTRGVVLGDGLLYCLEGNGQVELWRVEGLQGRKVAGLTGSGCLPLGPAVGGRAYFSMGVYGLWSTEGTAPVQLDPGTPLDSPDHFTGLGNTAYFTAINAARGREVWKTNGTPESTQRVWTAEDGSPWATIRWMHPLRDRLVFRTPRRPRSSARRTSRRRWLRAERASRILSRPPRRMPSPPSRPSPTATNQAVCSTWATPS